MNETVEGIRELMAIASLLKAKGTALQKGNETSLHRTGVRVRGIIAARARKTLTLTKEWVDKHLWFYHDDEKVVIAGHARAALLTRFDYTEVWKNAKPRGHAVRIYRNQPAQWFPHTFLVPLMFGKVYGGNGLGLAERLGRSRYPIQVLHAEGIGNIFTNNMESFKAQAINVYEEELMKLVQKL